MMVKTKTIVYLDREEVLKAVEQFVRDELSDDGQYYENIEIKTNTQIPDFRAECIKNEEL